MRHGRLPLVWGGNQRGDGKGGERVIGDYRNGMTLSEITQTELKIPSQLIILFLSPPPVKFNKVRSPSLILVKFPSVYRDDLCRQFRKCRPNVSVELGSLKFPLSL
jgi:hypothetical protein